MSPEARFAMRVLRLALLGVALLGCMGMPRQLTLVLMVAARISSKWKLDERQQLWLRVDGVVGHLASFPGRMDPRVQKLRRWLERDVLFPAAQRPRGRAPGR